jgi:hypothetical protein
MTRLKPQPRERTPLRAEDALLALVGGFVVFLLVIAGVGGLIVAAFEAWAVLNG